MNPEQIVATMSQQVDRGRRRTHAEMRQSAEAKIKMAALSIVAERGADQLTLAEAGERAGYSRALPAHYFKTREGLLMAVAEYIIEDYRDRLFSEDTTTEGGVESIAALISLYLDQGRRAESSIRALYEIINSGLRPGPLTTTVAKLNGDSIRGFARRFELARAAGVVRPDVDPQVEATLLLAALRGLMSVWLVAPETIDLDRARDGLIDSLMARLAVSSPPTAPTTTPPRRLPRE